MLRSLVKPLIAQALALLAASAALAFDRETVSGEPQLVQGDNPTGYTVFLRTALPGGTQFPEAWMLRTGAKKGIRGLSLDEELSAAPDFAVLESGFFGQWMELLFDMKEPAAPAAVDNVAALARAKPVLIIPSGGLAGTAGSEFFKAGLAEYVRSGGTLICFAQRSGKDFASLPVPSGATIEARGWAEDPGPVFGASSVRSPHPMLSRVTGVFPRVETSGSFSSAPEGAQVVLARSDGRPTLIVYPFGSGRVVLTALFSDMLSGEGRLDAEERALVQDLLLWAKAPEKTKQIAPGDTLALSFAVQGSGQDTAWLKLSFIGSGSANPLSDQIVSFPLKPAQQSSLPFTFSVPAGIRPGIYHFEYTLLGENKKPVAGGVECAEGAWSFGQPPAPVPSQHPLKSLQDIPERFRVKTTSTRTGDNVQLDLEILTDTASPPGSGDEMLVRVGGREKTFKTLQSPTTLSFTLSPAEAGRSVPLSIYHSGGRLLFRDAVILDAPAAKGVFLDQYSYLPGQVANFRAHGLGSGELTLTGLGRIENDVVSEGGSIGFPIPEGIPAGSYAVAWSFKTSAGAVSGGLAAVRVSGYRVLQQDLRVTMTKDRGPSTVRAVLAVRSDRALDALVKLVLRKPDGTTATAAESAVTLRPGPQDVTLSFPLQSGTSGVWELSSLIEARLPEGPGNPRAPLAVSSGRALFDTGDFTVLGVATDRPLYYGPSGPVIVTAFLSGKGRPKLLLSLDGKKAFKETIDLSGPRTVTASLRDLKPGARTLRAELAGDNMISSRETTVVYGTNLPDLVANIVTGQPTGPTVEVGIGIKNEGRTLSPKSKAALYDGDPDRGGKVIEKMDVPPLKPGLSHVAIIHWPVLKKTGEHLLTAVADVGNDIAETNKRNNRSSFLFIVPDFLLSVTTEKQEFGSRERLSYTLDATNLTGSDRKSLLFSVRLANRDGKTLVSDDVPLPEFRAAKTLSFQRALSPAAPLPVGKYFLTARILAGNDLLANTLTEIRVPPVLSLAGSLAGTPSSAHLCRPFSVRYNATNTGNVVITSGSMQLEIRAQGAAKPAYEKQVPFSLEEKSLAIASLDLPAGGYTLSFKASASNIEHGLTRQFTLAQQPLTIAGPVAVGQAGTSFPRVLVWLGRAGAGAERAIAEDIIRQALEREGIYYRIADTPETFTAQAMGGVYNTFVLFEVSDPLDTARWLRELTGQGQGMIIIGIEDTEKTAAGAFGFTFGAEPLSRTGALLGLTGKSSFGLSGSVPVSGTVLAAGKKGSVPLAVIADTKKPAVLIDASEKGKIVLLPFSLIRSARESGTNDIYSPLFRAAVLAAAPVREEQDGAAAVSLALSAPAGPVKARIVVTLPEKAGLLWTSVDGKPQDNAITYEMTLDSTPKNLMYLYEKAAGSGKEKPVTEVFYECDGKWMGQGKVE